MGSNFQIGGKNKSPEAWPDSTSGASGVSTPAQKSLSIEEYQTAYDNFLKLRMEEATRLAKQDMEKYLVTEGYMAQGQKLDGSRKASAVCEPISESEAERVFALMKSLEGGKKSRKAALNKVFRLLVMNGYTQEDVARECKCSPSLITLRVEAIERKMGRPVADLRHLATHLGEMNRMKENDPRARRLYRRGLVDDTGDDFED